MISDDLVQNDFNSEKSDITGLIGKDLIPMELVT
jgi:hypothetical protein